MIEIGDMVGNNHKRFTGEFFHAFEVDFDAQTRHCPITNELNNTVKVAWLIDRLLDAG